MKLKIVSNSLSLFFVLVMGTAMSVQAQQQKYPYQNPGLAIEERIDNLLSLMTLDEKIKALSTNPSVPRLGVHGTGHIEGLHGLALGGPANWAPDPPVPSTQFPQSIGMAKTWNPELIRQAASAQGYEARYIYQNEGYKPGALVIRAPNADLARDPRWGRNEESFGEDPFLTGTMTVAFVKGLQGDHSKYWQTASLMKHFLANSNEETRTWSSSDFDERLLREYYAVPFRMGVKEGGSRAYMAAYNAYNGIPMTVHPIMKEITVEEWGQDGIICTDAGALRLMVTDHKYYPDIELASAASVKAGINQFLDRYEAGVRGALEDGLLSEKDIDEVLRGVYRVMIRLGMLDPADIVPYRKIGTGDESKPWLSDKHKSLARQVTQGSIVLLKNENQFLPLDKESNQTIAVIGPLSNEVLADWYGGLPPYGISPLEGIQNKAGAETRVLHAEDPDSAMMALASKADIAIVVVGNHPTGDAGWAQVAKPSYGKEAVDRDSITLEDEELIKKVYRANPNTLVVLKSSFPYSITWSQHNIPAILQLAHSSQEEGNALADVIFGDYNPAGRLVQTWPRSVEQLPSLEDYNLRNGHTYLYFKGKPLYPFGYGLSYTTFSYSNLKISDKLLKSNGELSVSLDVANSGERAGDEVVQLYVKHLGSSVKRPLKELKGFQRVYLESGQSKTVQLTLRAKDLAYWDSDTGQFRVEPDSIRIMIGGSSSDIRLQATVQVAG